MKKKTTMVAAAVCAAVAAAWGHDATGAEPVPAFIFGQNLEHTRAAVQGGLSAEIVRNRKFAGKPSVKGVALMWEAYGDQAEYYHAFSHLVRHAAKSRMFRQNERRCQVMGCLVDGGEAGIMQRGLGVRGGVSHKFKAVVGSFNPEDEATMVLRVLSDGKTLEERTYTVNTKSDRHWKRISFDFTLAADTMVDIQIGVKGRLYGVVGAVSLMPADNFRGMRADVIEHLRAIGTSVIRWPGGNFAGEYRWRDGLIADPDERAPIQSFMEIETQTHSLGYDSNDIGMEDVLALCEKIGAEPFFTINAVWESPQDSADWVKACNGRVKMWSLGNEMGHAHMEGPKGPAGYAGMVRPHAEAMLKVDPSLKIYSSGQYPWGSDEWIEKSAKALADVAPGVSYHRYDKRNTFDFSTPERTAAVYARIAGEVDESMGELVKFRTRLPREIGISIDEWNLWYSWHHEEGVIDGLYTAKTLNGFMRNWKKCGVTCICYFQAVNEGAIRVNPFESHLTPGGETMRMWKEHVGGVPVETAAIVDGAFATDHQDGSRYITLYNFSTTETRTFRIPTGGRGRVVAAETLVPNGLFTGSRYVCRPGGAKMDGDVCEVVLEPACQSRVRVK